MEKPEKIKFKRLRVMLVVCITVFLVLTTRLAYLQIVQYDYYKYRAEENRFRVLPVAAPRGEIFDCNNNKLVANRPGFTVSLMDLGSGYDDNTISYLSEILDIKQEEIWSKIEEQHYRRYLPIRVKSDVDLETIIKIEERRINLPGIVIEVQPIRNYVNGSLASHVLGYLGEGPTVSESIKAQWAERGYEYREGDVIGQEGVERIWEPYLRGVDGGIQVEIDSMGRKIRELGYVEPISGHDLHLTIDSELQKSIEQALKNKIGQLRREGNNQVGRAAAVVMNPNSGEILSMVSVPGYDPNTIKEDIIELSTDRLNKPLSNKAIKERYPVGSVFKMVTGVAALEEGKVRPGETNFCRGTITRYGATKSCFRGTSHGAVDIVNAIKKSCNIFFYEMGLRVGIDRLAYYSHEFGFGETTGIKDLPGEVAGTVASRDLKKELFNEEIWYPAETMDASIGQGYQSITPLQLTKYVSIIANGGVHYRPFLVKEVTSPDGEIVQKIEPEVLHVMNVSSQTWSLIRRGMEGVTQIGGTAGSVFQGLPISVAGKTGSAQIVGGDSSPTHALFVGYAPVEEPEIAFAIIIEHGGTGGTVAAPVARQIVETYFNLEVVKERERTPREG